MIPNQSFRLLGAEEFAVGLAILVAIIPLQLGYLEGLTKNAHRRAILQIRVNRAGAITIMIAGAGLRWKDGAVNFYVLGLGILVTIMAGDGVASSDFFSQTTGEMQDPDLLSSFFPSGFLSSIMTVKSSHLCEKS